MIEVTFYCDGACDFRYGKGSKRMGVGIVALFGERRREWRFPLGVGTNNRAEILAIHHALLRLKDRSQVAVHIYTDSEYAKRVLSGGTLFTVNWDLIEPARALIAECVSCEINWVRGHAGNLNNERADSLANQAMHLRSDETASDDPAAILTDATMVQGQSVAGGWTAQQLTCFDVPYPFPKGWREAITGKSFPVERIERFLALGAERDERERKKKHVLTIEEVRDNYQAYLDSRETLKLPEPGNRLEEYLLRKDRSK